MAGIISASNPEAIPIYAIIFNLAGQALNGATFETKVEAHRENYARPLSATAFGDLWEVAFPTIPAGDYFVRIYANAGGAGVYSDLDEPPFAQGPMLWDGTQEIAVGQALQYARAGGIPHRAIVGNDLVVKDPVNDTVLATLDITRSGTGPATGVG